MPAKKSRVFSITLRPKDSGDLPTAERWDYILTGLSGEGKYLFSAEGGGSHYQCGVSLTSDTRSDLLRILIDKQCDAPWGTVALAIKAHDDWKYLIGYCSKESKPISNISPEEVDAGVAYYEAKKKALDGMAATRFLSIDHVADHVTKFCKEHRERWRVSATLCINDALKAIRPGLRFSVYQRINRERLMEYVLMDLTPGPYTKVGPEVAYVPPPLLTAREDNVEIDDHDIEWEKYKDFNDVFTREWFEADLASRSG